MPVLTMPGKSAVRTSLVPAVSVTLARALRAVRRPIVAPGWAVVAAVAVLAWAAFLTGRQHPAHHYVAYFGYPMVLDTTTGKACYAAPQKPANPETAQDPASPLDGTANQFDGQETADSQIPLCNAQ